MSFREFRRQVKACVEQGLKEASLPSVDFEPVEPPDPGFGDLSVNICFQLAKESHQSPMALAERLAKALKKEGHVLISSFDVAKPGYINFTLYLPKLASEIFRTDIEDSAKDTLSFVFTKKKILVEHTSVNPNKALHVGHLRNVFLGDSVYRILNFVGHEVRVLNYVDDSGVQVADVVAGIWLKHFPSEPPAGMKYDHYAGDTVYVGMNELYQKDPSTLEKQRQILRELEDPNSEVHRFARELTKRIMKEQLKTCWRAGARYDCLNFESQILSTGLWEKIFQVLKAKGIAIHVKEGRNAGCWVVKADSEGEEDEKVLVRSDGTATYTAKDIPYAAWKLGLIPDPFGYEVFEVQPDGSRLWGTAIARGVSEHPLFAGADEAITVIDARQSRLQRIISEILNQLAGDSASGSYKHLAYEVVMLSKDDAAQHGLMVEGKAVQMSGRKGLYINADHVLDALHNKAYSEAKARNSAEGEEWLRSTAEKIAVAAIRFGLLKQDLDKGITFNLREALDLEGETGPYIQYAHARASRILEKVGSSISPTVESESALGNPLEKELIKLMSKFDLVVEEAARYLSPKVMARYCYRLAWTFNAFYEKHPALSEPNEAKRTARLALIRSFRDTIEAGLSLMGIEAAGRI